MRISLWTAAAVAVTCLAWLTPPVVGNEKKPDAPSTDPLKTAQEMLAIPPRPARPALPPSRLPLEFIDGERIAVLGNSTAERMNLFGHFESLLH
jgi:hypothetical protein